MTVTKSQLRSSGKRLRNYFLSDEVLTGDRLDKLFSDFELVRDYRLGFTEPMLKVRIGLQSFTNTCGLDTAYIAQRLKRLPRILLKLDRYPTMQINSMQDIAGCRVVVEDPAESEILLAHMNKRWHKKGWIARVDDYTTNPQDSGYRALHVIAVRDERPVEVQIRTRNQHAWADGVESTGRALDVELKWGDGPQEVLDYFRVLADVFEQQDRDGLIDADRLEQLQESRLKASEVMDRLLKEGA